MRMLALRPRLRATAAGEPGLPRCDLASTITMASPTTAPASRSRTDQDMHEGAGRTVAPPLRGVRQIGRYHRLVLTFSAQTREASLARMAEDDVRRAGDRGRDHRDGDRARRGDPRAVGGAGGEGRLRRRDLGALLPAGPRRPALPGARRPRAGQGVAAGAGHAVPAGAAPGPAGPHVHAGRRPAAPGDLPGRADRLRGARGRAEHRLPPGGERGPGRGGHPRSRRADARGAVLRVPDRRRPADDRGGPHGRTPTGPSWPTTPG